MRSAGWESVSAAQRKRHRFARRHLARATWRRPSSLVRAILVLFVGLGISLGLGLWSAWLAVRSPSPIDAITLGPWQAWPNAGTKDVDPYSRARLARTGEIPLGSGEGLTLLAQ